MTINSSGQISLVGTTAGQSIEQELGGNGSTQLGLLCAGPRGLSQIASGAVTMPGSFYSKHAVPSAPTIGTATACGSSAATVSYTAPTCIGASAITSYTATSTPGGKTGTGASPIKVNCLSPGTAYTFKVKATNSYGSSPCSSASNSVTPVVPSSSIVYETPGTYTWVAPAGVTTVSAVVVGGGGAGGALSASQPRWSRGGGGGGLSYGNNISVTPGSGYTIVVGSGGPASTNCNGGSSYAYLGAKTLFAGGGTGGTFAKSCYACGVAPGGSYSGRSWRIASARPRRT